MLGKLLTGVIKRIVKPEHTGLRLQIKARQHRSEQEGRIVVRGLGNVEKLWREDVRPTQSRILRLAVKIGAIQGRKRIRD